jgi:hypothetical protein
MITLSHVLEHINQPIPFLHMLARDYLKPNGMIYIEVPMFEQHVKLIGDFHLAHKFYFTQKSLTIAAELAGFKKLLDDEDVIVVTPSATPIQVMPAAYHKALADSDALLAQALRRSRTISRRVALKRLIKRAA